MVSRNFILIDWGTSRLRAFLYDGNGITAHRTGPGIGALTGAPENVLHSIIEPWLGAEGATRVFLCGMVGSRNGIEEVPYRVAPAALTDWIASTRLLHRLGMHLTIAPGVQAVNMSGAPDVMRGEEAQIFGALRQHAYLRRGHHVFVLPGTHSKWVDVRDGVIQHLHTAFTGELHALLLRHSTLMKTHSREGDAGDGFLRGLARSVGPAAGLIGSLFEARSSQLVLGHSSQSAHAFLSGLLIGHEIAQLGAAFGTTSVVLIGSAELRELYAAALTARGVNMRTLDGDECVIQGLIALATSTTDVTHHVN